MSTDTKVPHEHINPFSTDWSCYKKELVSRFGNWGGDILTEDDIENSVNVQQSKVIAAYEKVCPLKRARLNQSKPYWSFDLAGLRGNNRSSNPEAYRKVLKEFDRALRRKQSSSWRDFCSNVEGIKPTARLHKILAKDKNYQIGGLRLLSDDFTASVQEVAEHLLETRFPGGQSIMENTARAIPVRTLTEKDWWHRRLWTPKKSDGLILRVLVPPSLKGEDGIFPALLKNGIEILSEPLVKIFTACLVLEYIPEAWQRVRVIFIPKPRRTSYELVTSFRPISLTSFLLKTMERLVDQSITMGPLKRFPLERSQYAYQRGRSSETALHDLVRRIKSALGHKIFALGAFLDVEGLLTTLPLRPWAGHLLITRCISRFQGGLQPCSVTAWFGLK
jgi:hypothetical protein